MIEYKIATAVHIGGIENLQDKYLVTNLSFEEKANGFVTTPFTTRQIEDVIANEGLFVGQDGEKVVAYVFTGSWAFFEEWPIFPHMFSTLAGLHYKGYKIDDASSFQYGPICIDMAYRGKSVARDIFDTMRDKLKTKYPVGLTFINQINERSYQAHTNRMGLDLVGTFAFNGNTYYSLAFLTNTNEG
jgi:hypothetical protein